ncbi:MAG: NADH-quinone oxidoreductase subunit L [Saezia sp.]
MSILLFLIILLPLLGYLLLSFSAGSWTETRASFIGVGSIALALLVALGILLSVDFSQTVYAAATFWNWIEVPLQGEGAFSIPIALTLDGLSLTMLMVVVGVGFLIHLFSSWYMRGEKGFSRFFAYTNLFIAFMLVLVLADNLLLLYLGWEGVGLCSYLLIGFYYKDPKNGAAAMKAFLVTRIGDVFMAIGLFILYNAFGTLNIQELNALAQNPEVVTSHSNAFFWAALLLAGGAFGKSAQLPLQTWLADAMAGPTPVSALIHAATMVTAGVYLIARMNGVFIAAPSVLYFVAVVGTVTLLVAGFSALVQTDIKRVLAYSTMSQLGYMFLALGVQAWDAAIFHLMTHAFFKALLFLGSGSVIIACHHEQNILKMGGLRTKLPVTFAAFMVGGAALAALPIITAGFYSKDAILLGAMNNNAIGLCILGLVGAFITSLYVTRLIYLVFFGAYKKDAVPVGGFAHTLPLAALMVLSTFVGALIPLPLQQVLPVVADAHGSGAVVLAIISGIVALGGVAVAVYYYAKQPLFMKSLFEGKKAQALGTFLLSGWVFDRLYEVILVKPYLHIANWLKNDPLDWVLGLTAKVSLIWGDTLVLMQNGRLRSYLFVMEAGAFALLVIILGAWFIAG